jgi:hypothetical protein
MVRLSLIRIIVHAAIPPLPAHCIKLNLTIESIVASRKMLPYARDCKTGEGAYDESTKQARVIGRDTTAISESQESREEDHAG